MVVTGVRVLIHLDRDWLLINQLHTPRHSLNTTSTTPPRASQTQQWRGLQTDATVAHPNLNLLYIFCFGLSRPVGTTDKYQHHRGDVLSRRWMMMTNGNASDKSFSPPLFAKHGEK